MCRFIMGKPVVFLVDLREMETSCPSAPSISPTICYLPELLGAQEPQFRKLAPGRIQCALLPQSLLFLLPTFASDQKMRVITLTAGNSQTLAQEVALPKSTRSGL